jgi:hypothetical protein
MRNHRSCSLWRRPCSNAGGPSRKPQFSSAGGRRPGATDGQRRGGSRRSRPPLTGESICSSSRRERTGLPPAARVAAACRRRTASARSTERAWSARTTDWTSPSTRRSCTAGPSGRCSTTATSIPWRASGRFSATKSSSQNEDLSRLNRAGTPRSGVLGLARISLNTSAPCVLASHRPSRPADEAPS